MTSMTGFSWSAKLHHESSQRLILVDKLHFCYAFLIVVTKGATLSIEMTVLAGCLGFIDVVEQRNKLFTWIKGEKVLLSKDVLEFQLILNPFLRWSILYIFPVDGLYDGWVIGEQHREQLELVEILHTQQSSIWRVVEGSRDFNSFSLVTHFCD